MAHRRAHPARPRRAAPRIAATEEVYHEESGAADLVGYLDLAIPLPYVWGWLGMAYIITENCTGCTACIRRCPTDAITGDRKLLHVINPELCIDCGACGVVCPDEAIFDHNGILCEMLKAPSRPLAYVDLQACVGCEWCVWACPFDALEMKHVDWAGPDNPAAGAAGQLIAAVIEKKCVGCTLCELDCPYDAIHIWRKDSQDASVQVERNAHFREEVGVSVAEPREDAA